MLGAAFVVASQMLLPSIPVRAETDRHGFFVALSASVTPGVGYLRFEAPRAFFPGSPPPPPGDFVSNNAIPFVAAGIDASAGWGIGRSRVVTIDVGAAASPFGNNSIDPNTELVGMAMFRAGAGVNAFLGERRRVRVLASLGVEVASFAMNATLLGCADCVYVPETVAGPSARAGIGYVFARPGSLGFSIAGRLETAVLFASHQMFVPFGAAAEVGMLWF
jgi:hypothetical protein